MIDPEAVAHLTGAPVRDDAGVTLGQVAAVYLDNATGRPEWVTVRADPLDPRDRFVPLIGASLGAGGELRVGVGKALVDSAPEVDTRLRQLSAEDEERLYRHYEGPDPQDAPGGPGTGTRPAEAAPSEAAPSEAAPSEAAPSEAARSEAVSAGTDDAMTRSEEQLRIRTVPQVTGRARLRKYTVTEYVTVTVPVAREDVRVEQARPATEPGRAPTEPGRAPTEPGQAPTEPGRAAAEHPAREIADRDVEARHVADRPGDDEEPEVVLYAERPVVSTERVPVERVRLAHETVTEEHRVTGEVRRERIAVEGDVAQAGDLPDQD